MRLLLLAAALALPAPSQAAPVCSGILTMEQRLEFEQKIGRPRRLNFTVRDGDTVKELRTDDISRLSVHGHPYLVLGRSQISEERAEIVKAWFKAADADTVPGWNSPVDGVQPPESWFGLGADAFVDLSNGTGTAGRIKVADLANTVSTSASIGVTTHVARDSSGNWKFLWSYLYQSNHARKFVLTPLAICAVDVVTVE
jgi:hypothetical protein